MTRYRAPAAERVACAQHIQARVTGVNQIQPAREKVETVEEFQARGGKVEVLPNNYGDAFLSDMVVPYGA